MHTIDINVDIQINYVQDDSKSSTITRIAQFNSNKKPQLVKLIKGGKQSYLSVYNWNKGTKDDTNKTQLTCRSKTCLD